MPVCVYVSVSCVGIFGCNLSLVFPPIDKHDQLLNVRATTNIPIQLKRGMAQVRLVQLLKVLHFFF